MGKPLAIASRYQQRAPTYDEWYERRSKYDQPETNDVWHAEVARLDELVEAFSGGDVLELACGTGWWHPALLRDGKTTLTSVDYSTAMLGQSRERAGKTGLQPRFVRADNYVLPFPSSQFDSVFFGFWLSHVPRSRVAEFFAEVIRVCRPGGKVLIIDSLFTEDRLQKEMVQTRQLPSGERYEVLKIYHTPEDLEQVLCPFGDVVRTLSTGQFFVVGELSPKVLEILKRKDSS